MIRTVFQLIADRISLVTLVTPLDLHDPNPPPPAPAAKLLPPCGMPFIAIHVIQIQTGNLPSSSAPQPLQEWSRQTAAPTFIRSSRHFPVVHLCRSRVSITTGAPHPPSESTCTIPTAVSQSSVGAHT